MLAASLALSLAIASCSHSTGRSGAPGSTAAPAGVDVLVTIGSDATFGDGLTNPLRDSWPQKLYHEAFARSAVLVNASDRAVRVGRALAVQVPLALEVHATVVAVWLGDTDLEAGFPVPGFEANLDLLVKRLSDSGARVLLGNISRARAGAAAYDDAIARIARSRGATLVDCAAALSATPKVGPSSLVDPATSGRIAKAFAAAFARS
jgi:hypothetical protein